jgi:hypothetical protein
MGENDGTADGLAVASGAVASGRIDSSGLIGMLLM